MPHARQVTLAAVLLAAGAAGYALWSIWGVVPARNEPAGRARAPLPEQVSDSAPGQARVDAQAAPLVDAQAVPLVAAQSSEPSTAKRAAERPTSQDAGPEPLEERALMAELRALGTTAPERALQLARSGNALFPNSPDAAERAWFVVKSLDSLGRFHEGRDEARTMVERYRGSSWAADVERHTLVYPLDQPSREEMQARERERDL